ncbi:MAG: exo-alpha-sialidase [Chloroflexi bacterium]|nr:exo-alpha-sialidase [Chloroflexota bacterium]
MKKLFLGMCILLMTLMVHGGVTAVPETPDAPTAGQYPSWTDPVAITTNGNSPNGAGFPVVTAAPNSGKIMVGFSRLNSSNEDDTDPYYVTSTNNGASWTTPAAIFSSSNRSAELDLEYDGQDIAHAVWTEKNLEVHYTNQNGWGTSKKLSTSSVEVSRPRIATSQGQSGNAIIDIVWSEWRGSLNKFGIFHTRSTNGGGSFTIASTVFASDDLTARPALAVDGNTLHVVWEEGIVIPGISGAEIYYAQGTVSGGSVSWSAPALISIRSLPNPEDNAKQPQIMYDGHDVHVSYTNRIQRDEQNVHHLSCAANCTTATNWVSQNNPVSGVYLGVSETFPFDVTSTLASLNGCTMAYYHGIQTKNKNDPEQILGTNSCSGWAAAVRDDVTDFTKRSANPNIITFRNWFLFLVYEEKAVDASATDPAQVQFVRNKPGLYLPTILRN